MSNINPNCDGSHCRDGYKEVRKYPSVGGADLYLCLPCFANANMYRYNRAKEAGRENWPQVSWSTAEVVYDKHGEPFDGEAAVRQGIVNYHQNGDGGDTEYESRGSCGNPYSAMMWSSRARPQWRS